MLSIFHRKQREWRDRWGNLQDGMISHFAFMRVDVVGHSRITRDNPSTTVEDVFDSLEQHIEILARGRNGRIWSWAGDGGLLAFHEGTRTQKVADAVATGRSILESLPEFNQKHPFETFDTTVRLRVAIHCGTAKYRQATGRIHSREVNYVSHLEHARTHPDSISISADVYRELPSAERSAFTPAGLFEDAVIYTSDLERGAYFPKRAEDWRDLHTAVGVLSERLRPVAENAVMIGFYRTSAVVSGMVAPNIGVRSVVILGRDRIEDNLDMYSTVTETIGGRRVIFMSLALDSATAAKRKIDYLNQHHVSDIVVAALFVTPKTLFRFREEGVEPIYAEERDIGRNFYNDLPWSGMNGYHHR